MRVLPVATLAAALLTAACGGSDKAAEAPVATETTTTETITTETTATEAATTEAAGTETAGAAPAATAVSYSSLTGDAAKGEKLFAQCKACHVVEEGKNRVGPSLYGVVGRTAGTVAGYTYSKANKESGVAWSEDVLFTYLEAPQKFMPGTKMAFGGLKQPQDRADVIAYLKTNG
ncbi:c-type cytochrome [Sandarakinorhabdus sp.]|uniref:c-type cytochrome n=1 Tax=Sandarakinorhabdus sp. TaxID=1916663 RepID=UPI003F72B671